MRFKKFESPDIINQLKTLLVDIDDKSSITKINKYSNMEDVENIANFVVLSRIEIPAIF